MIGVVLDTGFLITLSSPSRPHHSVADSYFRHCVVNGIPMFLPTLVAAEFAIGQPLSDLPLGNFKPLNFTMTDAARASRLMSSVERHSDDSRVAVKVDLCLLAQAHAQGVKTILAEDHNTMQRYCDRARAKGLVGCHVVTLKDGFDPDRLLHPEVVPLQLNSPAPSGP